EYTGLWCGFCPRGFVAMEEMNRLHPDDFVCVSYHSNGGGDPYSGGEPLQYIAEFPNEVDGFPLAFFNREKELDPYFGSGSKPMGILDNWQKLRQAECPADISVELSWADDRHDRLVCRSTTKFVEDADGTAYRVNYIITGDGFKTKYVYTDDGKVDVKASLLLLQSNYFAGEECDYDSEFWTPFIEGGKKIDNLVFNDVAMALSPIAGEEAFDGALAANTEYTHEYEFDYAKIVNLEPLAADGSGGPANVLPDDGSLRCIAVLLTADGKFVNCNKSKLLQAASVSEVTRDDAAAVSGSEWFDLQGRRVDRPGKGAYIRVDRLADGSVRRIKTIKR
ncbi:MAG: hypothetical protein K2H03_09290, partial [Muribaculaceae bacterium]|nr:hypothetical protein [Muribaculaceae bacterium]